MEYTITKIKENNNERFILQSENKYFSINEMLFVILSEYKKDSNFNKISSNVNLQLKQKDLTDSNFIENSIMEVRRMIEESNATKSKTEYIHNKISILKNSTGDKVYRVLSFLFQKKTFLILFSSLSVLTFLFFFFKGLGFSNSLEHLQSNITWINILFFYLVFFLIIFLHEIGHASASYSFGAKPKEIGFGLYFIFPVMYTNTTSVWELDKFKRITVNLGGIYMQLIINAVLITVNYFFETKFTLSLIVLNTISIITSFNPFFRYDGYWIFSDFFNIQNLREKSTKFINKSIIKPSYVLHQIKNRNFALVIYSLSNLIFWGYVYYWISIYIFNNLKLLQTAIQTQKFFSFDLFQIILSILFILFGLYNLLNKLINLKK